MLSRGWIVGFFLFLAAFPAEASEKICKQSFQAKKFIKAAKCYQKLVKTVDSNKAFANILPLLKDRYLRHAAISFNQAAEASAQLTHKAFYKEKAAQMLLISFQKGYCEAANRCRSNRRLADMLQKQVGYSTLVIVTGNPKAKLGIKGHMYSKETTKDFNKRIRPGKYDIMLTEPGKPVRKKSIDLKPNHTLTLNMSSPQVRVVEKKIIIAKKVPPLVLAGYGVGGALMAAGVGMIIYSVLAQTGLNEIRQDPKQNKDQTDEQYNADFDSAEAIKIAGGAVIGAGVLALAGSVVAHLVANASNKKKKVILPKEMKTISMKLFSNDQTL